MMHFRIDRWVVTALAVAAVAQSPARGWAQAALDAIAARPFQLSEAVQLDQADHSVVVQLDRVKASLADAHWSEAVDALCRLAELPDEKLIGVTERRFVSLRDSCQMRLAALPAEALAIYRDRVDSVAQKWYEAGIAKRDRMQLWNVVDQAFASSYGDKALLALGEMLFEAGDYPGARWCWERIVPQEMPKDSSPTWPAYPDTKLDLAGVRARLILVSILEGSSGRAKAELAQFASLHPDARGRLGGREVKYADALGQLLGDSRARPPLPRGTDWPTFAGGPARNAVAPPLVDVGSIAWRAPLVNPIAAAGPGAVAARGGLCFEPLVVGPLVLVNDYRTIQAFRSDRGLPAWGQGATIYQGDANGQAGEAVPPETLGLPHFSMTAFSGRLFARMGSTVTNEPQGGTPAAARGYLVCLDLNAQGRLLWKAETEEGWAFEGSPIVDGQGVYVAMRRSDIRPQAFVACLDAASGRLRWRRMICGAETPGRGALYESTCNLLTLVGDTLYANTNLGAVAAVRKLDGRTRWLCLYPRERQGDVANLAAHWQRGLNPCLYDRGTLLVAPADSPRVFAFDASTGQMLWQTGTETGDIEYLLGVREDCLIAGGRRLYWIGMNESDRGKVQRRWPDSEEGPGFGRGLLAGDSVLWPTRDKLYVFSQKTGQSEKVIDLTVRGALGGNLLVADGRLLVASVDGILVFNTTGSVPPSAKELTMWTQVLAPSP
jgi:outer membrane protein assembly factor BamB